MANMPLRNGTHAPLEEVADEMLRESMRGITHADHDILTRWKLADRKRHELHVDSGTPDASVRRGNFWRRYNPDRPDLNSREGMVRSRRASPGSSSDARDDDFFGDAARFE
jgi:hypothetical protein